MIKTNYLLNFITVLVFLYSCNSQNNSHNSEDIQSKAEIQEADISSVYMGFDMNKSFNETMESLKRIQKKDVVNDPNSKIMSLNEAIKHCDDISEKHKCDACGQQHAQLGAWLRELKRLIS